MLYEREKKVIKIMRDLRTFLLDSDFVSFTPLTDRLENMRKKEFDDILQKNLVKLRTSVRALEEMDTSHPFNEERDTRNTYFEFFSATLNYFETELLPSVRKLYDYLREQPGSQALVERLNSILSLAEEEFSGGPISGVSEASSLVQTKIGESSGILSSQSAGETTKQVNIITVKRSLFDLLQKHQRNVDDYVQGYFMSEDQLVHCRDVKTKLDSKRNVMSEKYWQEINTSLESIWKLGVVPVTLKLEDDYGIDLVTTFREEWDRVRQSVKDIAASPKSFSQNEISDAIDKALTYITLAIITIEIIYKKCKAGAKAELIQINALLSTILEPVSESAAATQQRVSGMAVERDTDSQSPNQVGRTIVEMQENEQAAAPRTSNS